MIPFPEILAPAGSPEQLAAAVRSGADAVYLGAEGFNARRNAANFSREQLAQAVNYCHEYGVRVYLTLNTLLTDKEVSSAIELLDYAASLPVDAVIVQDIGLASLIHRRIPDLPLHASTQATVHTAEGVRAMKRLGFSRVVLARELSAEEIADIANKCDTELEVFVHGALCMSVSGQCYMSAMLGSRSGNRGLCAQPCRLPFSAGAFESCLSLKDNSLISHIGKLSALGVSSLKIEGRMKRPEYCAAAVTACRLARDTGEVPDDIMSALRGVFSRSGFTDGYITGKRGRPMFGVRTKDDSAELFASLSALRPLYRNEYQRVEIDLELHTDNDAAILSACDDEGNRAHSSCRLSPGLARGLSADEISSRILKTGGTPYIVRSFDTSCAPLEIKGSELNALRRDCLSSLSQQRSERPAFPVAQEEIPSCAAHRVSGKTCRAVFRTSDMLPKNLPDFVERVYIPLTTPEPELKRLFGIWGTRLAIEYPRASFGNEDSLIDKLKTAQRIGIGECMVHNIAPIDTIRSLGMSVCGGFGLNIMNSLALCQYEQLGLSFCELSFELTAQAISSLGGEMPRGVIAYGYLPLMLTRNCPSALGGCKKDASCSITDRRAIRFPVRCSDGYSEVFNSIPLCIVDKSADFPSVDCFFLRFTVENPVEIEEIFGLYSSGSPLGNNSFTRGLYYRGVL